MNQDTKNPQAFHPEQVEGLHKEYWYHRYPEFWANFDDLPKDAAIVDVGCGSGVVAAKLVERGFKRISLIDLYDYRSFLEVKALPFHRTDLNFEKLPFPDRSQDMIVAPSLIEHLENPFFFIRECQRALKPGGRLLLTMYIGWNWISRLLFLRRGIIEGYQGTNNHITFMPKNIFFWATRGFKLERVFYERRSVFHALGFAIRFPFPRSEKWSKQAGYTLRKL